MCICVLERMVHQLKGKVMALTDQIHLFLIVLAIVGSGLVAGIFYSFSVVVMRGLARLSKPEAIRAMQAINVVVINRWFFSVFMGTSGLSLGLLLAFSLDFRGWSSIVVILGAVIYIGGCFLVTGTRNVPRNDKLDKISSDDESSHHVWDTYLEEWTYYNHVRTLASLLAMLCFLIAAGFILLS